MRGSIVRGMGVGALATLLTMSASATGGTGSMDSFIGERATQSQRAHAALQIELALMNAGLESEQRAYRVPNIHWALDLIMPPQTGINVVAQLPASTPSERNIIIGAHYDTVPGSPGADDNASGTYAAIELAERLSELPVRNTNITFVLFDAEEDGAVGSNVFAAEWLASGRPMHSMHNIDMLGYDGNGDGVFDLDAPNGPVADAYLAAADERGIRLVRANFSSSDHVSFRKRGFTAVFLSENLTDGDFNKAYHSPKDTVIDRAYMERGIDLAAGAIEALVAP